MRKTLTRLLTFFVFTVFFINGLNAQALETTSPPDKPITGGAATYCTVTFDVANNAAAFFKDDITITLKDVAEGRTYTYVLTYQNSYGTGNKPTLKVLANTTYKVSISYNNTGTCSIINKDGTPMDSFGATESGYTFEWNIISGNTSAAITNSTPVASIDTGNAEAGKAFQTFFDETSHISNDKNWSDFLNIYKVYSQSRAPLYVKYCGGKEADWLSLTSYEQFIYYELYIRQCNHIKAGMYDYYFGSENNFISNNINPIYASIYRFGAKEAEAFKAIMIWQYKYIKANGKPYNFMSSYKSNTNSANSNNISNTLSPDSSNSPQTKNAGSENNWTRAASSLRSNALSIIILAILAAGLVCFILYCKKKNIDDSSS